MKTVLLSVIVVAKIVCWNSENAIDNFACMLHIHSRYYFGIENYLLLCLLAKDILHKETIVDALVTLCNFIEFSLIQLLNFNKL